MITALYLTDQHLVNNINCPCNDHQGIHGYACFKSTQGDFGTWYEKWITATVIIFYDTQTKKAKYLKNRFNYVPIPLEQVVEMYSRIIKEKV